MSERLRILDELGAELDRAVRADHAKGRRAARRWGRLPLLATVAVLGAGGVAAAAAALLGEGLPLVGPRPADVQPRSVPLPGSAQLGGRPAPDPDGGPAWEVRTSRSAAGERCVAVGHVVKGRLGIVGLDNVFRALPVGAGEACGTPPRGADLLAGARPFVARSAEGERTVVAGIAGPGVTALELRTRAGDRRAVTLGAGRSFVAVLRGSPEPLRPALVVTGSDGRSRRIGFADTGRDEVADPEGGRPWVIDAYPWDEGPSRPAGLTCAQARRPGGVLGPTPVEPLTSAVCGRLEQVPAFVVVRRFVPGERSDSLTFLGPHPARTLVFGAVARDIRAVAVRGAGAPIRPRIFRPRGGFLAVLDGRVDPAGLSVVVTRRDGSEVTLRDSANLLSDDGRPLREPPEPEWRSVESVLADAVRGYADPRLPTLVTGPPVPDPAGGPAWVVRTYAAQLRGASKPSPLLCAQSGPLVDGRLLAPGTAQPLTLDREGDAVCLDAGTRTPALSAQLIAYAADPGSYAPGLARVAVQGVAEGALRLELLGLGAPREIPVVGGGGFLALLPGSVKGKLSVRATFPGGVRTVRVRGADLAPGSTRVDARTSDPDGAAPWAVAVDRAGCMRYGRLILDRLVYVHPDDGSVVFRPAGYGCARPIESRGSRRPVGFLLWPLFSRVPGLSPAQVARRTLSGRTVVVGVAARDVVEVEVRTPRDVRVLRPAGRRRAIIAVYDGVLDGGEIVLTSRMRDGRRVVQRQRLELR